MNRFGKTGSFGTPNPVGWVARLVLGIAVLGSVTPASALLIPDLYDHRVEVTSESEQERNRAFQDALRAVMLKVTGNPAALENPVIQRAIDNAQSYVEAFTFETDIVPQQALPEEQVAQDEPAEPVVDTGQAEESATEEQPPVSQVPVQPQTRRYIVVNFAESLIRDLLGANGIPLWDSNRPSVLVWLALQDSSGSRALLSAESNADIISYMESYARSRGLPLIFPVMDFEDRRNLSADQVWALDESALRRASDRYGADSILAGRLHFTPTGDLVGLWQFLFQEGASVFDGFDTELDTYVESPLSRITGELAGYFAVVPESGVSSLVTLRVEGIGDLSDYAALLAYLSGLNLVDSVSSASIDGERLDLNLALQGDARQLLELITLDRDLLPVSTSDGDDAPLHFRWTR